jgi:hypothetical protein
MRARGARVSRRFGEVVFVAEAAKWLRMGEIATSWQSRSALKVT